METSYAGRNSLYFPFYIDCIIVVRQEKGVSDEEVLEVRQRRRRYEAQMPSLRGRRVHGVG